MLRSCVGLWKILFQLQKISLSIAVVVVVVVDLFVKCSPKSKRSMTSSTERRHSFYVKKSRFHTKQKMIYSCGKNTQKDVLNEDG